MKVMVTTEREEDRPHVFLEIKMSRTKTSVSSHTTLKFESSLAPNAILNRLCTMISPTSYKA